MPSKKSIIRIGLMTAMGVVIVLQGLYICLPVLAEYLIRQRLPALPGGFESDFTVESVGLRRTRIRDLVIGEGIRADSLEVLYAWRRPHPFRLPGYGLPGLPFRPLWTETRYGSTAWP